MARRPYNPREIIRQIEERVDAEVQETALAILTNVTLATPVGDPTLWQIPVAPPGYVGGHARRNWQVSIGGPGAAEIPGVDPSGLAAIADGQAELGLVRAGGIIYLEHTVPYAGRLNRGWSTQAPPDYVGTQIDFALLGRSGGREVI